MVLGGSRREEKKVVLMRCWGGEVVRWGQLLCICMYMCVVVVRDEVLRTCSMVGDPLFFFWQAGKKMRGGSERAMAWKYLNEER